MGDDSTRKLVAQQVAMLAMGTSHAESADRAILLAEEKASSLDCVLIDVHLPGLDLWGLLDALRQQDETRAVPVMAILSRPPSDAELVMLIEAGVTDHLVRPLGPALLCAKVRAVAERSRAQREIANKLRYAIECSAHDPLTGLYNRRFLERRLREESAHAARHKRPFAVVIVDIDHFKLVNDTYGHEDGDRVLRHVAGQLEAALRADDIACRYGGEEFVCLLRATTGPAARVVANRLRASLAAKGIPLGPRAELRHVTLSGGVAAADERNEYDARDIVARADKALYRAKRAGRNRVEMD